MAHRTSPLPRLSAGRPLAVALLAALLCGCSTFGYYGQAVGGQWALMQARRPVPDVIADPATPAPVREKLRLAAAAREFASRRLALPDNASYDSFVALDRQYVVWNVFAAPPLSLELAESCFPVVGCLSYRGYFSEAAANAAGAAWRARGYDVYVGGVAAYSTLGWFADPLLSSMLQWEDAVLVRTLFHELAHQRLYVRGDSTFNESFATAVAEAGFARWRAETAAGARVAADASHEAAFVALLLRYQRRLARVYREAGPEAAKLAEKTRLLAALRQDFDTQSRDWSDRDAYARWLARDLNNAKLASVQTYHTRVPAFTTLLRLAGGDFPRFYAAAEALGAAAPAARTACLDALPATADAVPAACAPLVGAVLAPARS